MEPTETENVTARLMDGDPVIRRQAMRDLCDRPAEEWRAESRRRPNGRRPVEKRIPGTTLFDMERMGGDSRWNTLRALRVLRGRQSAIES